MEFAIFKRHDDQCRIHILTPEEILALPGNKIEDPNTADSV